MKKALIVTLIICLAVSLITGLALAQSGTYEAPPSAPPPRPEEPTYNIATIDALNLKVGDTVILSATPEPSGADVTWSSGNVTVATVQAFSPTARVTAISSGTARIVVSATTPRADGSYWRESVNVTVTAGVVTPRTGDGNWLLLMLLPLIAAVVLLLIRRPLKSQVK